MRLFFLIKIGFVFIKQLKMTFWTEPRDKSKNPLLLLVVAKVRMKVIYQMSHDYKTLLSWRGLQMSVRLILDGCSEHTPAVARRAGKSLTMKNTWAEVICIICSWCELSCTTFLPLSFLPLILFVIALRASSPAAFVSAVSDWLFFLSVRVINHAIARELLWKVTLTLSRK